MPERKVVIVTGVSSGIGRAAAAVLAGRGYLVFGTVRSPSVEVPTTVERLIMDVRDERSIARAVADVVSRAGRIDALVNNAGRGIVGAAEETNDDEAHAVFDVNFFGAARVTRSVLPTMRAQRSGRIIFVSSIAGFVPAPFMAMYSASKHALEGYSQSLDHEVRALGIRSVLIEPGFFKTRITENTDRAVHRIDDYTRCRERVATDVANNVAKGQDPAIVAKGILRAIAARRPKLRYQVGRGTAVLARLRDLMPAPLFDRTLRRELRLDT
ncbi:MAG TPA: oxidoreductase [Polyangia bacterium]|nr:oxidoreductase [Polyangia bacterium]